VRIDAHQHFWIYDPKEYPWIPDGSTLQRNWLPTDLAPHLSKNGIDGTIAVQARQSEEESRWLLTLADHCPSILGVVGWVDLCSDEVDARLSALGTHPRFVGVRHVLQDEADDRFMLRPHFMRGIAALAKHKLTYDLLIYPRHLESAITLARTFPNQPFVVDHLAKPAIKTHRLSPWREQLTELARLRNVCCKLSGMLTEADHHGWKRDDFVPYIEAALEAFGTDRVMFGSDWPVCLLAGSYEQSVEVVAHFAQRMTPTERDALFGGNAARFYLKNAPASKINF
jgi:L-fuconolactonase